MPLRDRFKRVFRRSSLTAPKTNRNGVKIEYYHRNEIPKSKFKGPFDPEHQKQLAAWSFQTAMADRRRSLDLSLSPCTSLPDYLRPPQQHQTQEDEEIAPDQVTEEPAPEADVMDSKLSCVLGQYSNCIDQLASPSVTQVENVEGRQADGGSQSSTMVDPESYSGSMMTLLPENQRDNSIFNIKETIRHTSPAPRTASPPPMSPKGAYMPFSPEDLTRALNAVQIY